MKWEVREIISVIEPPISGEWGNEPLNEGDGVKVLRTTNFTNDGEIDFEAGLVLRDIDSKKVAKKVLKKGDLIIEKSGGSPTQPVGRVVFFDREEDVFLCNNFTAILRAKPIVDPRFLFYFLFNCHREKVTLSFQNKTTGIINLKLQNYLEKIQIPLPPLNEQRRIASILDRADALRRKDRVLLEQYERLGKAVFWELFGGMEALQQKWSEVKIADIVKKILAGSSYSGEERPLEQDELGVLKISAVTYGEFQPIFKAVKKADIKGEIIHPQRGDLLFSRANTRELVAATCIVDKDYPELFLPDKLWKIVLKENLVRPIFFKTVLSQDKYRTRLTQKATGTSGSMLNISMSKLLDTFFPLPPISEQIEFEKVIERVGIQKELIKSQLTHSTSLFHSLLHRAFRGEL